MKELLKSISSKEWRFVAWLAAAVIIITAVPYLVGFLSAPAGYVYDGLGSLTPGDNPVYYSYLNQIENGDYLSKDLFTGETQTAGLLNVFWLAAGIFVKITGWPIIFSFHLLRLLLIPVFVSVAYLFISLFFSEIGRRKLALTLLLFSGGLGAYLLVPLSLIFPAVRFGYSAPNDIWIPESITFLALYKTPHFIASLICMLLIFLLMFLALEKRRTGYAAAAGLLALFYFNFHPFYIPLIFGAIGLYILVKIFINKKITWSPIALFSILIVLSASSIFYHFYALATNPVLAYRALQNVTVAPPFIFIIIGYGFLWLFAGWGIYSLIKNKKLSNNFIFLLCWLAFSIVAVIMPSQFQSRYTQGLHFPLVIFSVVGLLAFKDYISAKAKFSGWRFVFKDKFLLAALFILMFCFSNVFNITRDLYYFIAKPENTADFFYLPKDSITGIKYLAGQNDQGIVLAAQMTSYFVPVYSLNPVYAAHPIETSDFYAKDELMRWVFSSAGMADRKFEFLKKNNIKFIFHGELEKKLGGFDPDAASYLEKIYDQGQVQIYRVLPR